VGTTVDFQDSFSMCFKWSFETRAIVIGTRIIFCYPKYFTVLANCSISQKEPCHA